MLELHAYATPSHGLLYAEGDLLPGASVISLGAYLSGD